MVQDSALDLLELVSDFIEHKECNLSREEMSVAFKSEIRTGGEEMADEKAERQATSKQWLYFIGYCLVALIVNWYTKFKGKDSELLVKIKTALKEHLTSKQLKLYDALKQVYKKLLG